MRACRNTWASRNTTLATTSRARRSCSRESARLPASSPVASINSAWSNSRPMTEAISTTFLAVGGRRSSRAISDPCKVAGMATASAALHLRARGSPVSAPRRTGGYRRYVGPLEIKRMHRFPVSTRPAPAFSPAEIAVSRQRQGCRALRRGRRSEGLERARQRSRPAPGPIFPGTNRAQGFQISSTW